MIPVTTNTKSSTEMRAFAKQVVKESDCVVKFGATNGQPCLHLILQGVASSTIYAPYEWAGHPWNKVANRRKETKSEREASAAVHSNR